MSTLLSPRMSSVDRILPKSLMSIWLTAHYGSKILDHAERHLRDEDGYVHQRNLQAVHTLRNARTDLASVMEYLNGIAEVQS